MLDVCCCLFLCVDVGGAFLMLMLLGTRIFNTAMQQQSRNKKNNKSEGKQEY